MADEMITVEFAGRASRQVGNLPCYDVRAWWAVRDEDSQGRVKLAAGRELKKHVHADHVEFVSMDMDTYKSPHINAMLTFSVLTKEQYKQREARRREVHSVCVVCGIKGPGQLVLRESGEEQALCYLCWHPIRGTTKVLHWINRNGKLNV
ncbi:hypothetical protein ACFWNC_14520 [Streptomyces sp. NPDC058369]|uniref:hypothetical protein n=1 Tax=Streptomyces sp. NPDC058369 TaxID=3346462 RepID=UPI003658BB23